MRMPPPLPLPPRLIQMLPSIPINILDPLLHHTLPLKPLIPAPQPQRRPRILNAIMIPTLDLLLQEEIRQKAQLERALPLFEQ